MNKNVCYTCITGGYDNIPVKFSIIMPTYNRAFCIEQAIDSVLAQTYQGFELIIIDDASSDNTQNLINSKYYHEISSGKIIYHRLNKNSGVCVARNYGLGLAHNNWITYCDTDNKMLSNHLEEFKNAIIANPGTNAFYAKIKHRNSGIEIGQPFLRKDLEKSNFIDMGVFCHNRDLVSKYGGFDTNLHRLVDWDLILTYTKDNTPGFIDMVLLDYNDDNSFARISNSEELFIEQIKRKHNIKFKSNRKYPYWLGCVIAHIIPAKKNRERFMKHHVSPRKKK